ncbi:hypothetical protein CLIB1444_03S04720 [[Candida] jaroonii]|uniref:Uncharacterized protein n=1 Tax=[Candida] jaroonii TaxID=467808 RepID=A0ACA9Y5A0_9ASCO|nr:hypothetical protein CLIB1444_03S04720 [[Candida] jaroonii]
MFDNTISIPLVIEDKNGKTIKESYLNLGIKSNGGFDRIVTGAIHEGTYRFELSKSIVPSIRSYKDEKYDDTKWEEAVDQLLSYDKYQCKREDLIMTAKFVSEQKNYDEDGDLVEDFETINDYITIDIKTKGTLSRLYGSFQLKEVDDATDLLYWLKEIVDIKDEMLKMYTKINDQYESLVQERDDYKKALDDNILNHDKIISDLERKFYLVLDSKKKKIIQLTSELRKDGSIDGLNEIYEESQKHNLENLLKNKDKLPTKLDDIYVSPRKRKAKMESSPRKKNRNLTDGELTKKILGKNSEDDEMDSSEYEDDEVNEELDEKETEDKVKEENSDEGSQMKIKQENEESLTQMKDENDSGDTIYSTSEDEANIKSDNIEVQEEIPSDNIEVKDESLSDNTIYSESD